MTSLFRRNEYFAHVVKLLSKINDHVVATIYFLTVSCQEKLEGKFLKQIFLIEFNTYSLIECCNLLKILLRYLYALNI